MNITITINTGNAAFDDRPGYEVARILRDLADRFDGGDDEIGDGTLPTAGAKLFDINGNTVGSFKVTA